MSISLSLCIYIYIYTHACIYISLSLSLYIYIFTYTHIHIHNTHTLKCAYSAHRQIADLDSGAPVPEATTGAKTICKVARDGFS